MIFIVEKRMIYDYFEKIADEFGFGVSSGNHVCVGYVIAVKQRNEFSKWSKTFNKYDQNSYIIYGDYESAKKAFDELIQEIRKSYGIFPVVILAHDETEETLGHIEDEILKNISDERSG